MNKDEIDAMLDNYFKWLRDKTTGRMINGTWAEITTPYLDPHNDYIQIYARRDGQEITLTDDGSTLSDLSLCGCPIDSPKRQEVLHTTLRGFGVELHGEQITVKTSTENFPRKKHDLIQAMLAVNDLLYVSASQVTSLFLEDVTTWFDNNDIRYTPAVMFKGISTFNYRFDFAIPKTLKSAERIIQTITNPSKEKAMNLFFRWIDTKEQRPVESSLIAVVNDTDKPMDNAMRTAFTNYNIKTILWSEREKSKILLTA